MAVSIDLSDVVGELSPVYTQLRVTMPGGVQVQGTTPGIGASPLGAARATVGALNAAMAPLAPVFAILDAVLSIVKFAQSVPGVVMRPDKVVSALVDVLEKAGALAKLVPQLSVPLMILGCVDVLIAFLRGIRDEVQVVATMQGKLEQLVGIAADVPAMTPIASGLEAQINARKAQISCGLGDVKPLLGIVNTFCELVGLPPIAIDVTGDEPLDDVLAGIDAVVKALVTMRSAIPV